MTKIGIVGLGYVGLCTAVCFAKKGLQVVGLDVDSAKLRAISNGEPPFFEKNLKPLLKNAISGGNLACTSDYGKLADSDFIFITVGTPTSRKGRIDLGQVRSASRSLGQLLAEVRKRPVVVVKSTVVPGTSAGVVRPLLERYSGKRCGRDFGLCSNPEFLREGSAIEDTEHPDKVVVGSEDDMSSAKLLDFYGRFYRGRRPPFINANLSTAELIKYSNNAFLALKITFINTIAGICEKIPGSDVKKVAAAIGLDSRIGPKFLEAGPGYGGSCFPKDVRAMVSFSKRLGVSVPLLEVTEEFNSYQARHVAEVVKELLGTVENRSIALLGLAFKAGTDDVRESPSLRVVDSLLSMRGRVRVYDPAATENAKAVLGGRVSYARSVEECVKGADLCLILNGWDEFRSLTPRSFKSMRRRKVIDARRVLDPGKFAPALEFRATGLGRNP